MMHTKSPCSGTSVSREVKEHHFTSNGTKTERLDVSWQKTPGALEMGRLGLNGSLLLTSCVVLVLVLKFSEPLFPHT